MNKNQDYLEIQTHTADDVVIQTQTLDQPQPQPMNENQDSLTFQPYAPDIAIQIHTPGQPKSKAGILANIRSNLPALAAGAITAGLASTLFIATTEGEWLPIEICCVGANLVLNMYFGSRAFNIFKEEYYSADTNALGAQAIRKLRLRMSATILLSVSLTAPIAAVTYNRTLGELAKKIAFASMYLFGRFPINFSPAHQIPSDIAFFGRNVREFHQRKLQGLILKNTLLGNLRKVKEQLSVLDLNQLAEPTDPSISSALPSLIAHIETTYPGDSIYSRLYNRLAGSRGGKAVMSFFKGASKLFAFAAGGVIAYSNSGYSCEIADGLMTLLGAKEEARTWYLLAANIIYLPVYYLGAKGGFTVAQQFLERVKILFKYGAFLTNNDRMPDGPNGKVAGFIYDLLSAGFAAALASLSGYSSRLFYSSCPIQFGASAIMPLAGGYNAIWVLLAIFAARAHCLNGGSISYDKILDKEIAKVENLPAEEILTYLKALDPVTKEILCSSSSSEQTPLLSKLSSSSIGLSAPGQSPFVGSTDLSSTHPGQSPFVGAAATYQSV
jgi:hypothetical protein